MACLRGLLFGPFLKDFHKYAPDGILSKNGPSPQRVIIGAELTRLGANCFGAEVQGHFLHVVDVAVYVAQTWHELSVNCYGVDL